MSTQPFADMGEAAVCARVAIALVKKACKEWEVRDCKPPIIIGIVTARLDGHRFDMVRSALLSLNHWWLEGGSSQTWLQHVLYCDMMGYSFRRCYFTGYKAHRRDPRVTNRGVKPPAPVLDGTQRKQWETKTTGDDV